jgi:3-dehydroquinate dehydratase-1
MTKAQTPAIVGVIFSRADLRRALALRSAPDLFEVRLDAPARIETIRDALGRLQAPLIIAARHPREGGFNELSAHTRRGLLRKFLPLAAWVDIELRSVRSLKSVFEEARWKGLRTIISFHDFRDTPSPERLDKIAAAAHSLGTDVLKIATRTDAKDQLLRLVDFFDRHRGLMNISAMGIGRLGRISRLKLARRGSVLNYAHLGTPRIPSQLSIAQLRAVLKSRGSAIRPSF